MGNPKRSAELWKQFSEPLRAFILKRVSDEMLADDLLQEVFVKIHTAIDTLEDDSRLESWIYQIARNTIIDHHRTQKTPQEMKRPPMYEEQLLPDAEDQLASGIQAFVAELPAHYRRAIELTEFDGLTQREMGEKLGLSVSGAKSRVQRARKLLKEMLLECCHFTFDNRGGIVDYQAKCHQCACEK